MGVITTILDTTGLRIGSLIGDPMIKVVAKIYWIFKSNERQTTPYFSTCLILTLIVVINIASLATILNVPFDTASLNFVNNDKINGWVNTILKGTFLWVLFALLFPKKRLEKYEFAPSQLSKAKRILIIVIILSVVVMSLFLIKSGIDKGIIKTK